MVTGGIILSLLLHGGVLAFLVWHPQPPLPEPKPDEQTVTMVYETTGGAHPAAKSAHKAAVPAPPSPVEAKAPPALKPPKPQPVEPPPPAPPPPRPVQAAQQLSHTAVKTPVQQRAPVQEKGEVSEQAKPKTEPVHKQAQVKAPDRKVEKPPAKPQLSHTEQQHEAKKTQEDSRSLLATLDEYRSQEKQEHPPKAVPNQAQGGSPRGGGRPDGDTGALTSGEQNAIGSSVQRCYQEDTLARNYQNFSARMMVTVDASGEARMVTFLPETRARMAADPSYRVQAERARDAVLSPTCSRLPVPKRLLGQVRQFRFLFKP
ncbi:energy transducer TonB [Bombella dulcis]|uniref:energy transducer TonB n=1 Tax=Bombella dulcis TaxID=2967339 RepID=UPI003899042E